MRKLKEVWNDLSLTRRNGIKTAVLVIGVAAVILSAAPLMFLLPVLAVGMPGAVAVGYATSAYLASMAALAGGITGAVKLPGFINEIKHGKDKTTWKNALGQTIKSTQVQQKDLVSAQQKIQYWSQRDLAEAKRISEKFQAVADKVTVVKDVENGDGKLHFAQQKTETKVVTKTTVTPL